MVGAHVQADLLRYAERRLDAAGVARVEAHLAGCAACRAAAAETAALVDALQAMPAALRALPGSSPRRWAGVWRRVRQPARRAALPRLSFGLSLATAAFSLLMALPAGLSGQPAAVTAGVVETPGISVLTPRAAAEAGGQGRASAAATSAASGLSVTAGPAPIPTPVPGPGF
jgi:anti-sigma factor RsiW